MKMVVWSETLSKGGNIEIPLPCPTARKGFYRDVAVLAYPSLRSEIDEYNNIPMITASDPQFESKIATDKLLDSAVVIRKTGPEDPWIQFDYGRAVEIRSAFLVFNDRNGEVVMQVSDDGHHFEPIRGLYKVRTGNGG
jgi:hypothetical protein